ncbi:MAG TPA: KH domain-containing protein [Candidatus Acidoferrales bacterium]|nr:KH domain-containing protein [Candidatus Acidoferrales bacterium]
MDSILIPVERARKLKGEPAAIKKISKLCGGCKIIMVTEGTIELEGEPYAEFSAKGVLAAFGRGFDVDVAAKLVENDYYFTTKDIGHLFGSSKRVMQVKARIIGENGRTKRYIEEVTGARISVYGDTVSFIGTIDEITEAEAAMDTLIDGGTHKLAYMRMEAAHRKNKAQRAMPGF